jgi:hypothetical protein
MNVFEELENNDFVKRMFEKDESEPIVIEPATQLDLMDIPEDVPMDLHQDEFRGPFKIVHGIDLKVEIKSDKESTIHQTNDTNHSGYAVSDVSADEKASHVSKVLSGLGPPIPNEVKGRNKMPTRLSLLTEWLNSDCKLSWQETKRLANEDFKNSSEFLTHEDN